MAYEQQCWVCSGSGEQTCSRCDGTGKVRGNVDRNRLYTCSRCGGTGKEGRCWKCLGSGMIEIDD